MATPNRTTLHQPRTARPIRKTAAALLNLAVVIAAFPLSGPSAQAAPTAGASDRPTVADAEADLQRVRQSVADAEETLQRLTVEAEAVADQSLIAQAELAAARTEAEARAAELTAAQTAVDAARENVAALGRETFMGAGVDTYGAAAAFMNADAPEDVLQRAATLEHLGDDRAERLDQLEVAERRQQALSEAAVASAAARDEAARSAAEAERVATERLAAAQQTFDAAVADKAAREQELQAARNRVQALGGTVDESVAQDEQTAGSGQAGAAGIPTSGRVTSCYGSRWGTVHQGIDIAAPIGTPIHAPQDGVVLEAGPATGFGLAVYLQHDDGSITVYGHIDRYLVSAGERVAAGREIARVGNRGQSTGPHLHFEVHRGGLYQNRTDPGPWLAARGLTLGGACG